MRRKKRRRTISEIKNREGQKEEEEEEEERKEKAEIRGKELSQQLLVERRINTRISFIHQSFI